MVQLNTTYDSSIHQKIFVLKGDEGYARTTDTIATLITNFGNYTTYISKCHVGLEIQVLRELGDSFLHIYCDDEELYSIPWSDSGMAQIIDEDWNEKGVYWENGKLIIGKYDYENNINTGLFLLYDVEHIIKVRYDGNKNCLGSSAKPIVFTVPTPDYFATELSFNKATPPRYTPNTTINDITVTLTSDNELTSSKLIDIYDDATTPSTLLTQVELEQDVPSTITLTGLSDGLHKIRASWTGDWECYASDSELDVSVGYKLTDIQYPSFLYTGQDGDVSCFVSDYFDEPWSGQDFALFERRGSAWYNLTSYKYTDSNGFISFTDVDISSNPYAFYDGSWHSETMTTEIIEITDINVSFANPIVERGQRSDGTYYSPSNRLTATVMGVNNQPTKIAGIPLTITPTHSSIGTLSPYYAVTDGNGQYINEFGSKYAGVMNFNVSVDDTQVSNSASFIIPEYWWSISDNKQVGTPTTTGISISKTSNGYRFAYDASGSGTLRFGFNPNTGNPSETQLPVEGIYSVEFDIVEASNSDLIEIEGHQVFTGAFRNKHIRLTYDFTRNDLKVYENGTLKQIIHESLRKAFKMSLPSKIIKLVIDNLVIVREE